MFCQTWKLKCCQGDIIQISHNSYDYLLDMSSVLIIFVFGNNLIKTSFEAKVIRSLENCFFSVSFGFMFKQCHPTTAAHNFYKKHTGTNLGCSWDERWIKHDFLCN